MWPIVAPQRSDAVADIDPLSPSRTVPSLGISKWRESYRQLCRPKTARLLESIRLDVAYERASGDCLYARNEHNGQEVEIIDFVGGYGAAMFGHNHPTLRAQALAFFSEERPFAAQGSHRTRAAELAQVMHDAARDRLGESFAVLFANSGAEAVEAALKHAEMSFQSWLSGQRAKLELALSRIGRGLREGRYHLDSAYRDALGLRGGDIPGPRQSNGPGQRTGPGLAAPNAADTADTVLSAIRQRFADDIACVTPMVLALAGAFHGKSTGALSLTHYGEYRQPFARILLPVTFLPINDRDALDAAIQQNIFAYSWPEVGRDNCVREGTKRHTSIIAMFVEPMQGEAGIHACTPAFLQSCRKHADECGFMLVFDEIQSGMGRTGTLFYSEQLGTVADVYLLSKSLGGGMAKISAAMIKTSLYDREFGHVHTSTFAEDDFSATMALCGLRLLLENDGALMDQARRSGEHLLERLRRLAQAYPEVVKEVRGAGLMIGFELAGADDYPQGAFQALAAQDMLGYVVAGYLLHEHQLRVMPCISNPAVLRLEPSVYISERACAKLCHALEVMCHHLRRSDAHAMTRYLIGLETSPIATSPDELRSSRTSDVAHSAAALSAAKPAAEPTTQALATSARMKPGRNDAPPRQKLAPVTGDMPRVAFIGYFIDVEQMLKWEPTFAGFSQVQREILIDRIYPELEPSLIASDIIHSPSGARVALDYLGMFVDSRRFYQCLRGEGRLLLRDKIDQAVAMAQARSCSLLGFGGLTSVITANCRDVKTDAIGLTTGNALTVAMCLDAAYREADRAGMPLTDITMAAVGATGNIGSLYCELASDRIGHLLLIAKPGRERELYAQADRIYERAYRRLAAFVAEHGLDGLDTALADAGRTDVSGSWTPSDITGLSCVLARLPWVREWLQQHRPAAGVGVALRADMERRGVRAPITVSADFRSLRRAHLILGASNVPEPIIRKEHLGPHPVVIIDVAIPGDSDPALRDLAPRVKLLSGGLVDLGTPNQHFQSHAPIPTGQLYACAAEAVLLGLEGWRGHFSRGAIHVDQVTIIRDLVQRHGFTLAAPSP